MRALFRADPALVRERLSRGEYPTSPREVIEDGWGELYLPDRPHRVDVPEYWLITDFVPGGGGFGDPLERDPAAVAYDVRTGIYTHWGADVFFGVRLDDKGAVDAAATEQLREQIRRERLATARPVSESPSASGRVTRLASDSARAASHAGLSVSRAGAGASWTCRRCSRQLGSATDDYHSGTVMRVRNLADLAEYPLPAGQFGAKMLEFMCPGCGTLLDVEISR
jgi:N-methylhydantoinase B